MSETPSKYEFDDELLSAYLDDELSEADRARVEARLTADPAAQQMLDELRHVSQSIRNLPTEAVPQNLQETIIRRAKQVKRSDAQSRSDLERHTIPMFTVGRTRRGWIWASLAAAAGLMIMFTQRAVEDDRMSVADRHYEPPSLTASSESELADNRQSDVSHVAEGQTADTSSAASAPSSSAISDESEGIVPARPLESSGEVDDELVVVHVLAKRKALEHRAFDQLLISNGIAVEPTVAEKMPESIDSRQRALSTHIAEGKATSLSADAVAGVDVVFVDAPQATIFSCMSALNNDYTNYLGVSVDETPSAETVKTAAAPQAYAINKLAVELGKYNRGTVSQQQRDLFGAGKANYYQQEASGTPVAGDRGESRMQSGAVNQEKNLSSNRYSSAKHARAKRMLIETNKIGQVDELRKLGLQMKPAATPTTDNMQVLFVLSPGDEPSTTSIAPAAPASAPAASPAADNPRELETR